MSRAAEARDLLAELREAGHDVPSPEDAPPLRPEALELLRALNCAAVVRSEGRAA